MTVVSTFPSSVDSFYTAVDRCRGVLAFAMTQHSDRIFLEGGAGLFPSFGVVRVGAELVKYSKNDGSSLSGLTRGQNDTHPLPHSQGLPVELVVLSTHHNQLMAAVSALQAKVGLQSDTPDMSGTLSARASALRARYWTPRAAWNASRIFGPAPLTVQFADVSAGFPVSWFWEFGGSVTSDEQNPSHTFNSPGLYDVALTVTTRDGKAARTFKAGHIEVLEPSSLGDGAITVEVWSEKQKSWTTGWRGRAPLSVRLIDQTQGTVWRRQFSFGDGSGATLDGDYNHIVTHVYEEPGIYAPSVTAEGTVVGQDGRQSRIAFADVAVEVLDPLAGYFTEEDATLPICDERDLFNPPKKSGDSSAGDTSSSGCVI